MEVRPAAAGDVEGVRAVAEAAWWETYPGTLDTDTVRSAVDDLYDEAFLRRVIEERDDMLFLVAVDEASAEAEATADGDGAVVGFATAQQTWADEVEIHTLYVDPERWGEGIGTRLLESVEASAEAAGVDRLRVGVLSGNRIGRSFFEGRGFERVETVTAEVGDERVPEDAFERPL